MKFLIDADCPRAIGHMLMAAGHDVRDIRDVDPLAPDQKIFEIIKKESRVLITRDTDFSNILRYPVSGECGIILLRTYLLSVDEMSAIVKDVITAIPERELIGSLTVVRKGRYRVHRMN